MSDVDGVPWSHLRVLGEGILIGVAATLVVLLIVGRL
jgi:hypothetical protein